MKKEILNFKCSKKLICTKFETPIVDPEYPVERRKRITEEKKLLKKKMKPQKKDNQSNKQ